MVPHHTAVWRAHFARFGRHVALQELAERALADEADAGRILFLAGGKPCLAGDFAHFALEMAAQREQGFRQLFLIEAVEKVALVLGAVLRLQQLEQAVDFAYLGVVAGGDLVRAQAEGVIEKGAELDLGIAQDVGVGRAAGTVFLQEVGKYLVLVFLAEIDGLDLDADAVGDGNGIHQVLPCRAERFRVVVLPVLHEQADHFIALLLQQQRGDGRIDPARHADHDALFFHRWVRTDKGNR
ncbi:hypothetical protein GALL_361650 [mine drainage metagenome]|uniref:Uncharacterized protein n=1 Tax=mine drainage metagenome TaxID=410659 RepID=A0A1J5QF36_9ZZZZ